MKRLVEDLKYGLRILRKNPGFASMAVLALALGIGANSAMFSVVNGVLFHPLPFYDPARLVVVFDTQPQLETAPASLPDVMDWKEQNQSFEHLAAFTSGGAFLDRENETDVVSGAVVDADLFSVLHVEPMLGRGFSPEENKPGTSPIVILSYKIWQRRFNADPNIIGRNVSLSGRDHTVIGVMPESFDFPNHSEIWRPLTMNRAETDRGPHYLNVVGRLKLGVTLERAQTDMSAIAGRLSAEFPEKISGHGARVARLDQVLTGNVRPTLFVLAGAVGLVLLIACANVANLLLVRSASRRKEFAVRVSLGATRARLVRQLVTENMLLSFAGGAFGLALAYWGVKGLVSISPSDIPRVEEIGLDRWVTAFTAAVSLATGLIFGLAPAMQASRADLADALKEGGRTTPGRAHSRMRGLFVISEVALALVLLIGAGLMIRTLVRLHEVNPGFNSDNVLTMRVALLRAKYSDQQVAETLHQLPARLESVPGVLSSGAIGDLPLSGRNISDYFLIDGRPEPPANERPLVYCRVCTPGYFRTMGIPLLGGRDFGERDTKESPNVVVISELFARRFFPGEDPIGNRLKLQGQARDPLLIIGVVGSVRHQGLDLEPVPEAYVPALQDPLNLTQARSMTFVVRTAGDPSIVARSVRDSVTEIDRSLPIYDVKRMGDYLDTSLAGRRFTLLLLDIFAGVALALAAVGIYGVVSYSVSQRTHEIGVRMALGAKRGAILGLVVREGLSLTLIGVAVGIAVALVVTRFAATLLFEISPTDPLTFVMIPMILAGVALAASLAPARRATKVDPMIALRCE